jgi:2-polyprenyl-6-methoxyphenol hydroxylase-like FAD-dependent oxidoreductase
MATHDVPAATTVCVAGCGPAGAMLGYLLARSGIDVVVLEKHADFFRDFRGDTIHPSTLQVLDELGLLPEFERLPQQRTTSLPIVTDHGEMLLGDFSGLPGRFQYLSMVPQWDFLDFLTAQAGRFPAFTLCREAQVEGLVVESGAVRGVRYRDRDGAERNLRALLTVGADGRNSTVRAAAWLPKVEHGAPMDVLWYRIPKAEGDPEGSFARLVPGRFMPMIDRGDYWQGACTMPKGSFGDLQEAGIGALQEQLRRSMPFPADRVTSALRSWDDTGFLEVRVDRLRRWHRPGLLCIGDAAHAMSPVAGVGINLAVMDAVAAANLLAEPLRSGRVSERDLARVQRRRAPATRLTQRVQRIVQWQLVRVGADPEGPATVPLPMRVVSRVVPLRRLLARFIGLGFRPEHVRLPAAPAPGPVPA